ncbi:MAG: EpsG family protein [Clostridiales bacterium]|nr:EpsG family protein [Clostridiales bacterium]
MILYCLVLAMLLMCSIKENILLYEKKQFQVNSIVKSNTYKKIITLSFCIFMLMFVFRGSSVGTDTKAYLEIYSQFDLLTSKFKQEPIFLLINFISKLLGCQFFVVLTLVFVVQYFGFYLLIRKVSPYPMCTLFFMFSLGIWGISVNGMRQFMAVGLFALAIYYLIKEENRLYFLACILATFCHASALVLIPIYFIKYIKLDFGKMLIIGVITIITIFALPYIIKMLSKILTTDYYNRYIVEGAFKSEIGLYNLAYLVGMVAVFVWFFYIKTLIPNNSKDFAIYNIFLNLFFINVIVRLIATFSGFFPLVSRFTMYFFWSIVFLIPYSIKYFQMAKLRKIYLPLLQVGGIVFFYFSAIIRNSNDVFPYKFYVGPFSFSWFLLIVLFALIVSNILFEYLWLEKNKFMRSYK